jgi:hypothetical protein
MIKISAALTTFNTRALSKRSASCPAIPENNTYGRMNKPPARLVSSCGSIAVYAAA